MDDEKDKWNPTEKDEEDPSLPWWNHVGSSQHVKYIRNLFKLPKLEEKTVACKRCKKDMVSLYIGTVRQHHQCARCKNELANLANELF